MRFSSVTLLGSTGSIGTQTLDVMRQFPRELRLVGLSAAGRNLELMAQQVAEFRPPLVHVGDGAKAAKLRTLLPADWVGEVLTGPEGLCRIAAEAPADIVMVATVGWTGLEPALRAIDAGRSIALANKEVLVCGGHLVTAAARAKGVLLLPVDSEHNAIAQCLLAGQGSEPRRIILTCSGGPFRNATRSEIDCAGPESTLNHPTWNMGDKVTVDSATLMNKGFEVIEAHHLFRIPFDRIEVVVHPQSVIHSMVEYEDGSIIAQLGRTDMRLPIQNVLTWPERRKQSAVAPLCFKELASMTFAPPDLERFPCLQMVYAAGKTGGSAPCVLNAANEVAVDLHLRGQIACGDIPRVLRAVMEKHDPEPAPGLERLRYWDQWGRKAAYEAAVPLIGDIPEASGQ